MEFYFLKVVPSASELSPNKALEEAFEHISSKADPNTKFVHCYKVVGEQTVVAVIQASSADAADKFVATFTQDTPLIGQGRLLSSTCTQLINYKDLEEAETPTTPTKTETKDPDKETTTKDPAAAKDTTDSASVKSAESDASSESPKSEAEATPYYWLEVFLENGAGGNANIFSQFLKNDVKEATKKLESHGATVFGFKVIGEKKFQYFVSGVTMKDFEVVVESMPIMSMPSANLSCRRVKQIKSK